ncbi:hypothetical protein AX16_006626 [Volvariella volvacea WC 439]|nr:hypothetical protein AX16_006626 [Volvariella volvacea WC 439]
MLMDRVHPLRSKVCPTAPRSTVPSSPFHCLLLPASTTFVVIGSREAGHMALNRLLRSHATRIKSLAVRTSSDLEAQAFLSSIYDRRDEVPEHSGPPPRCAGEGAPCTPTSLGEDACCRCSGLRYPLQRLTISVSSSHHNPNTSSAAISPPLPLAPGLQPSFPSPTTAHFDHHRFHSCPHPSYALPSLTTVKISSPSTLTPFPFFPWHNLATVRDLSVSRPFTAPPLSAKVVEQLLKATSRLRRFELDSRVDDSPLPTLELGDGHEGSPLLSSGSAGSLGTPHPSGTGAVSAPSHHSSTSQLATPQGVGHLVVNHDALLASNNHDSDSIHQTTSDIHSRHSLTTLPYLTHLNLRSNDIPLLLDNLVLPRLQHLAINDLDGKRRGGAMESVKVLRRVLVRMDLPMENGDEVKADEENPRTGVDGLVELKLDGVAICGSTPKSGNVVGGGEASFEHRLGEHSHGSGIVDEDEIGMWGWCLKRMRALKKLSVQRVGREDAEALLEMLMESVARKDLPALGLGSSLSLMYNLRLYRKPPANLDLP